jgi:uncharacterized membrane protein
MTATISGPSAPDRVRAVSPGREDGVVRGLSEAIGGPLGDHASGRPLDRLLTPARIIVLLAIVVFGLHWIQKSPCNDGRWENYKQYALFCYTDVMALYHAEGLDQGAVPYVDHAVEYPVLTGYLMGLIGLPVHAIGENRPGLNQYQVFYNLTALVLMAFGLAAIAVTIALRRRRQWDALLFVFAPALVFTATVNWDLFAVGLTAFFLYAWAKERPVLAGAMLGLATAAKFYPLFLIGPLIVLAIRTGRWRAALTTIGTGALTWFIVNFHAMFFAREGWLEFFRLSTTRAVDWGTFWYIGANWPAPLGDGQSGIEPFVSLARNIPEVNFLSYLLFGLGCLGVFLLGLLAPRRPRLAQLCFLVVALFLLTSKVWSQQFVLWLIPLAVLARPRWGAFLVWQVAELAYFFGFYAHLLNLANIYTMPEPAGFVYFSTVRWWGLVFLVAMVVRDIVAPHRDVVWETYREDPDGGDFVGARDSQLTRDARDAFRHGVSSGRARVRELVDRARERVRAPGHVQDDQGPREKTTASG